MRTLKHIIVLLWLVLLSTILPLSASAEKVIKVPTLNVSMNFDGVNLKLPEGQHAFIYNGTTYVPVRFISYALKKEVEWNGKTKEVTLSKPNSSQLIAIKELIMNASTSSTSTFKQKIITLTPINVKFLYIDQTKVTKEKSSFIMNGTLYVPIRFLSELVGNEITWDQKRLLITGKSQLHKEKIDESTKTESQNSKLENGNTDGGSMIGGSSGSSSIITYESIITNTENQLNSLYDQSKSSLTNLAIKYFTANDAEKSSLKKQGKEMLNQLSSSFESIVQNAETQLKQNGYSTEIIKQYRDKFASEIEAGKDLAEGLGG